MKKVKTIIKKMFTTMIVLAWIFSVFLLSVQSISAETINENAEDISSIKFVQKLIICAIVGIIIVQIWIIRLIFISGILIKNNEGIETKKILGCKSYNLQNNGCKNISQTESSVKIKKKVEKIVTHKNESENESKYNSQTMSSIISKKKPEKLIEYKNELEEDDIVDFLFKKSFDKDAVINDDRKKFDTKKVVISNIVENLKEKKSLDAKKDISSDIVKKDKEKTTLVNNIVNKLGKKQKKKSSKKVNGNEWAVCLECGANVKFRNLSTHVSRVHGTKQNIKTNPHSQYSQTKVYGKKRKNIDSKKYFGRGSRTVGNKNKHINMITNIVLVLLIVGAIFIYFNLDDDQKQKSLNLIDYDVQEDVKVPETDPDIIGRLIKKENNTLSIRSMSFGSNIQSIGEETIKIDEHTILFYISSGTNKIMSSRIVDISAGKTLLIWGYQNADNSWYTTHIGYGSQDILQDLGYVQEGENDGGGGINLDDITLLEDEDITMPDGDPNLMGRVGEFNGVNSFILHMRDKQAGTSSEEEVRIDEYTNIFGVDLENNTVSETSIDVIEVNSMVIIWGFQNSDDSWFAMDIGLMQEGKQKSR